MYGWSWPLAVCIMSHVSFFLAGMHFSFEKNHSSHFVCVHYFIWEWVKKRRLFSTSFMSLLQCFLSVLRQLSLQLLYAFSFLFRNDSLIYSIVCYVWCRMLLRSNSFGNNINRHRYGSATITCMAIIHRCSTLYSCRCGGSGFISLDFNCTAAVSNNEKRLRLYYCTALPFAATCLPLYTY